MLPPISPDHLDILIGEAFLAARRLHRRIALPAADLDDLRQDLLLDLICRLPHFDPLRGSIGAFANVLLQNRAARIALRHHRQRRAQGGPMLSLDAPAADGGTPLISLLAEGDGLAAWHGQARCATEEAELRHDLLRVIADLPADTRGLCAALRINTMADLAGMGGRSRSALYRRLDRLRLDLAMRGLGGRWGTSEAA